jgi:mannose-1-phosphate guanylyltransferase
MLTALIMAGGRGTRFWPASTDEHPKQFIDYFH